jgi:hypothetical protein
LSIVAFGISNVRMDGRAIVGRASGRAVSPRASGRRNGCTTEFAGLTAVASHAIGIALVASACRRRWTARACNCDTRDSFTPSSAPMSFIVTSP